MTYADFREKYPNIPVLSENSFNQCVCAQKLSNLTVSKHRYVSNGEREITQFLNDNGLQTECNRQILIGKEIDILIPDKKVGIEYDGLLWHTEGFGKKHRSYHLNKTLECNKKGYALIHIFEDEFENKKDVVFIDALPPLK